MKINILYISIFIAIVLISSISQVILKKSSQITYENKIKEYFNSRIIVAYSLFFLCTIISTLLYKHIPLSLAPVLESSGYVFILVLSAIFLNEKVSIKKIVGNILIIIGIIISII